MRVVTRHDSAGSCADPGERSAHRERDGGDYVVSNVVENGVAIGSLGYGEVVWHTDMSYLSMLFALELPPVGSDMSFCGMYPAF